MATVNIFKGWDEAFEYCREADKPMLAKVKDKIMRIFPSGRAESYMRSPTRGHEYINH